MHHGIKSALSIALISIAAMSLTSCSAAEENPKPLSAPETPEKPRTTVWDDNSILYPLDSAGHAVIIRASPSIPPVKVSEEGKNLAWLQDGWVVFSYDDQNPTIADRELMLQGPDGKSYHPVSWHNFTDQKTVAFLVPKNNRETYVLTTRSKTLPTLPSL